jgi:sarcosine/dimethylglycine N-methyltransferase
MGSPGFYRRKLAALGLQTVDFEDLTSYLPLHYGRVLEVLEGREGELSDRIGQEYRTNMKTGLQNWVTGGNAGNLAWGIFHARA